MNATEIVTNREDFKDKLKKLFIPSCIKDFGDTEPFNIGYAMKNWTFFYYSVENSEIHTVELIEKCNNCTLIK